MAIIQGGNGKKVSIKLKQNSTSVEGIRSLIVIHHTLEYAIDLCLDV